MKKRVFLNVLLVLSLGLILVACGGSGGGDDDGGTTCTSTFSTDDMIGTWIDSSTNPPVDLVMDYWFYGLADVTSSADPEFSGKMSIDAAGNVELDYTTFGGPAFDIRYDGTWYGAMSCDKSQITFTREVFTATDGTSGDDAVSQVFVKQ